jgi:hypothetical protein
MLVSNLQGVDQTRLILQSKTISYIYTLEVLINEYKTLE